MPHIVLKPSVSDSRYVIWSTAHDAPVKICTRQEMKDWYERNKYSRFSIYRELDIVDQRGSSDEELGWYDSEYLPIGESLCPPNGWWRIRRNQLPELADRIQTGEPVLSLLEKYAD